jgi:hypothetical protein
MCVISMVHDHYDRTFPNPVPNWVGPFVTPQPSLGFADFVIISKDEADRMHKLIADFRSACEAAKVVDKLTGQPDCLDPGKAKLEARVAELEKKLTAIAGALGGV